MDSENSNMQRIISNMPFVRSFVAYYRQNIRLIGTGDTSSRYFSAAPRYQGFNLFDQRRFFSANKNNGVESLENRDINISEIKKSQTSVPPSGGKLPFFNWTKWVIGSIFTLLMPFLYTQWNTILKIRGEAEIAKEAIEKTAESVEKIAEMTEKAAKEAEEEFPDNEKLKKAADVVEHASEIVEKEALLVEDIIHKVDGIEEDVKNLVDPISKHSKHEDANKQNEDEHLN